MSNFPEPIGSVYTPQRPQGRTVAPVQPARRVDDSIHRQREMARAPVAVEKAEIELEKLRRLDAFAAGEARGRTAQRAIDVYAGVARTDDREYVSQMLGVDEFA